MILERENVIIGGGLAGMTALSCLDNTLLVSSGGGASVTSTMVVPEMEEMHWVEKTLGFAKRTAVSDLGVALDGWMPSTYGLGKTFISIRGMTPSPTRLDVPVVEVKMNCYSLFDAARKMDFDMVFRTEVAEVLKGIEGDSLVIPPIMGINNTSNISKWLENELGKKVFEQVTSPSPVGLREMLKLKQYLLQHGKETIEGFWAHTLIETSGGVEIKGHLDLHGRREVIISAKKVVLATGPFGAVDGREGDVHEPLTGILLDGDRKTPDLQIPTGPDFRVEGFREVYAVGGISSGYGLDRAIHDGLSIAEVLDG